MDTVEHDSLKQLTGEPTAEPGIEYSHRAQLRRAEAAQQMNRFRKVGVLRLVLLATALVSSVLALKGLIVWWWVLPPWAAFLALAEVQARISRVRRRCQRAAEFYEQGLERLDDRWAGKGKTG